MQGCIVGETDTKGGKLILDGRIGRRQNLIFSIKARSSEIVYM